MRMSPVRCPYCQFELEVKRTKPGRFKPLCPGCKKQFILKVPVERDQKPSTRRMPREGSTGGAEITVSSGFSKPLMMPEIRGRCGEYEVLQKLGQGGTGAVYLARQVSLDRHVALKVLSPELGSNPRLISWLARQAYAAAQLCHDNIAQIYDIDIQPTRGGDLLFFAIEFVEGETLADLIKDSRKVDSEAAVGYVLQAARGLKFAHDHGLTHRNIKPSNLLLDDHGMVKVADLGLVDRSGISRAAYAPPDLTDEGGGTDGRADIYSLGCTLYEMLTGQAPIPGRTATEAIAKAKQVPVPLLFIVMKMMSARALDRYQSMSDVIGALEGWLRIGSGKPLSPAPGQVQAMEQAVERFNGSRWKKLRSVCIPVFLLLSAISIVLLALPQIGHPVLAAGMVGFVLAAVVVYQILLGISGRTFLLCKLRELVFDSSLLDWLLALAVMAIGIALLISFDLQWVWLAFAVAATAVVATFFSTIDVMLASDRKEAIAQTVQLLKELRLRGYDENAVRQFVCRHAGRNWEDIYEALFGFEAKLLARQTWGQGKRDRLRPKSGTWREPIITWLDRKVRQREQRRKWRLFTSLEANVLTAGGIEAKPAGKQARSNARCLVEKAEVIRQTSLLRRAEAAMPAHARAAIQFNAQVRAISPDWIHDDSRPADEHDTDRYRGSDLQRQLGAPFQFIFGPRVRLVLAVLILAGFALWRSTNKVDAQAYRPSTLLDSPMSTATAATNSGNTPQSLRLPYVPDWICDAVGSWNGGLVGMLLLISAMFSGATLGFLVLLSAATGLLAYRLDVPLLLDQSWVAAVAAGGLWILAMMFARRSPAM
jgi:serine/threonine protein kinase